MSTVEPEEGRPRGSVEFAESSVLEAFAPSSSVNIEQLLQSWDGSVKDETSSILPFVSQRQFLLFDELLPVIVVLRTPQIEESTLKSYLSRLAINLELYAVNTAPNPEAETYTPPTKELLYSETIKDSYDPIVCIHESEANTHVYVVWKVEVFISRPRARLNKPGLYFAPAASLKPPAKIKQTVIQDEYLPSKVPAALNLLQSFSNEPGLGGVIPHLSAMRISKVAPTTPIARELMRPVRSGQRRLFKAAPALIWRIRYSRWQSSLKDTAVIASLDLEIAHITSCSVTIDSVELILQGGRVEPYGDPIGISSSILCNPGDQLTLLYKLIPDAVAVGAPMEEIGVQPLDLKLSAKVLASEDCRPKISIDWRTTVDFSLGSNPALKGFNALGRSAGSQRSKPPGPDSLPPAQGDLSPVEDTEPKDINISLTISGPSGVKVGGIFHWKVFIVNRSDKARKLAVLVIPKRRRSDLEKHRPLSSTSSTGKQQGKDELLAKAVIDDNIVYAKQKNARQEPADLVSLTTDVRIGHLSSGACYTAEPKFLALAPGVLSVDALRVVDLATQEATDIRDLPSIIAKE
ncbi:uncharacterized protein BDZ99DRAFT_438316 [Mytilinidion resinicola]|uniref:Trafficking protein particle complex II-specific subunit 65 IgD3 domain-containing protein n=1 Tax=Mytilinidion resinicola TaxID=574789 RepID=A0A6A6YXI7_9PEZI|nr:uncharacterized protein BDZ99DRAFT_438316 [Mytilinidion resinicola]KAF2813278.1 hypothetical protein BDZ99DRAFT_438316 [Mytilinidion resinicola]